MTHDRDTSASGPGRSATDSTSESLLLRVRTDDPEAWQRLLDLYSPLVYSWCRRADMTNEDAADVLQEVFRAVSSGIAAFRHDKPSDTFRGWLRTIARNKIRDHFRKQAKRPAALGGTDAHERFMQVADDETNTSSSPGLLNNVVRQALDLVRVEFEERTWQAFWQAAVDKRPAEEIADQLGMTPGAVRQAKYRVLRRLRRELGDAD